MLKQFINKYGLEKEVSHRALFISMIISAWLEKVNPFQVVDLSY
jgi:hypothetical protein